MERRLNLPLLNREEARSLSAGDLVYLSGEIYAARDAAHRRFLEFLDAGKPLPFPLKGAVIYYMGPSPAPPGRVIGSAGPTTSYRMDAYTPALLAQGLGAMIGKGRRSPQTAEAIQRAGAVYFGAIGGAGALLSERIKAAAVIAFDDLGAEAVRRLWVEDFPVTVIIDSRGQDLYETGPQAYLASISGGKR
jgi:fumarate hydratase subunit beta